MQAPCFLFCFVFCFYLWEDLPIHLKDLPPPICHDSVKISFYSYGSPGAKTYDHLAPRHLCPYNA